MVDWSMTKQEEFQQFWMKHLDFRVNDALVDFVQLLYPKGELSDDMAQFNERLTSAIWWLPDHGKEHSQCEIEDY